MRNLASTTLQLDEVHSSAGCREKSKRKASILMKHGVAAPSPKKKAQGTSFNASLGPTSSARQLPGRAKALLKLNERLEQAWSVHAAPAGHKIVTGDGIEPAVGSRRDIMEVTEIFRVKAYLIDRGINETQR